MRDIRCYHRDKFEPGSTLELEEGEARHLATVLRMGPGDPVHVLNGLGEDYEAVIETASKRAVTLRMGRVVRTAPRPRERWLCMALTKSSTYEDTIQRAVELGMTAFLPLRSERTVIDLDRARGEKKVAKWMALGIEALKQSERLWLPLFRPPMTVNEALEEAVRFEMETVVLMERAAGGEPLRNVAARLDRRGAAFLVGPEGGWSDAERADFSERGLCLGTIGDETILRTETAALAALAISIP